MIIAPSLLAANHGAMLKDAQRAAAAGAPWLHLDIMDGHFVPNLTFGPGLLAILRPRIKSFLDVHLMCAKPEVLLQPFAKAGADSITVHAELEPHVNSLIWKIRHLGKKVGLAINPPTPIACAKKHLSQIDLLLIMTVNPGFGGQPFLEETIPKIQQAAVWRAELGLKYRIEVDGGITEKTAVECARAGADTFVSGTALFSRPQLKTAVRRMQSLVEQAAERKYDAH